MIQVNLDPEGAEALARILSSYLSDLRFEIADTERQSFREQLHQDEAEISKILQELERQGVRPRQS
jgi:acetolactate synthase small subunit